MKNIKYEVSAGNFSLYGLRFNVSFFFFFFFFYCKLYNDLFFFTSPPPPPLILTVSYCILSVYYLTVYSTEAYC